MSGRYRAPGPPGPTVHPTEDDPVVAALSEPIGGPVGTRVRDRSSGRSASWWKPVRVLLALTALSFALGLVAKSACVSDQWRGETQYSHVCTSEIADAYTGTGLVELSWPWDGGGDGGASGQTRHSVLGEPALVGLWSYAAAQATHVLAGSPDLEERYAAPADAFPRNPDIRRERVIFVGVNAIGLAVLALLVVASLAGGTASTANLSPFPGTGVGGVLQSAGDRKSVV